MSPNLGLSTENKHVEPLYKHVVYMDLPNLFFIGVAQNFLTFPRYQVEAQYVLALLTGFATLPPSKQMHKEWEDEKKRLLDKGTPVIYITGDCPARKASKFTYGGMACYTREPVNGTRNFARI